MKAADKWFVRSTYDDGVTSLVEPYVHPIIRCNIWHVQGDVVDLGERRFEILHLPGHTPCSIGLWEERTRTLFAGDATYDGPLLDFRADSDTNDYIATMKRLRDTPARVVHAGHEASVSAERLVELADRYLASRV